MHNHHGSSNQGVDIWKWPKEKRSQDKWNRAEWAKLSSVQPRIQHFLYMHNFLEKWMKCDAQ